MNAQPSFWRKFQKFLGLPQYYQPVRVEDLPDIVETSKLYLVGDGDAPWYAALQCPCGCGAQIKISLLENDSPNWSVDQNRDGSVDIAPSIWRTKGCGSHFFVKANKVLWTKRFHPSAQGGATTRDGPTKVSRIDRKF